MSAASSLLSGLILPQPVLSRAHILNSTDSSRRCPGCCALRAVLPPRLCPRRSGLLPSWNGGSARNSAVGFFGSTRLQRITLVRPIFRRASGSTRRSNCSGGTKIVVSWNGPADRSIQITKGSRRPKTLRRGGCWADEVRDREPPTWIPVRTATHALVRARAILSEKPRSFELAALRRH